MDASNNPFSVILKRMESLVASNVIMGLFLVFFEKMLDSEFLCPCYEGSVWNTLFVSLYFLGPIVTIFALIPRVLDYPSCCCICCCLICLQTLVPSLIWVIILLLDGRYVACASTNWSGIYEATDGGGLMRWCKPDNNSFEKLSYTQRAYTVSQVRSI